MYFQNELGLYAFLFLVPFVILWLRKPKPQDKKISSLMFFSSHRKKSKMLSFLQKLMRNFLFVLQFIVIVLLAFSIAQPYINVNRIISSQNTILILDMSASAQAQENGKTRFDSILNEARNNLRGDVSIIAAESVPIIILEKGSKAEAKRILSKVKAKDTGTNLGDALLLSYNLASGKNTRVVLISDFINTQGQDPLVAKRTLTSADITVDFIDVGIGGANAGIIKMESDSKSLTLTVKNFDDTAKSVKLSLKNKDYSETSEKEFTILPNSIETAVLKTFPGINEVILTPRDSLASDNNVYFYVPKDDEFKALLLTNKKDMFLYSALRSVPGLEVRVAEPPIIPNIASFDLIVMNNVKPGLILPGTIEDIYSAVSKGKIFVFAPNKEMITYDTLGLSPVTLNSTGGSTVTRKILENQFTKDYDFGTMTSYLRGSAPNTTSVMISAEDNSPLIALSQLGLGSTIYFGLMSDSSNFKHTPDYPLFWKSLLGELLGGKAVSEFNLKTGMMLSIPEQRVKTPSAEVVTSKILLDEVGVYTIGTRTLTSNLLNSKESSINSKEDESGTESQAIVADETQKRQPFSFEIILIVLGALLLVLEMLYLKYRGDL